MKYILDYILIFPLVFLISCSTKPEPFAYGKDNCHTCKMGIVDPKFGCELITKKGKIYKFDDLTCLHQFLKSNSSAGTEIKKQLVINFEKENDFLSLEEAVFILSPIVKSPMGSHAAAFASREHAEKMNHTLQGELLSWNELSRKLEQR
jgi:copper chaperone NosL